MTRDVGLPAFEIILAHGRSIKVWPNGRTEGVVGAHRIYNRIPVLLTEAHQAGWDEGKRYGALHGPQSNLSGLGGNLGLPSSTDTDDRD